MKKIIFAISILFSIQGIFSSYYFLIFDIQNFNPIKYFLIFETQPYIFEGLSIQFITNATETSSSSTTINLLNLFFYLTFLLGSILFYVSKFKETRLLKFNYSMMFFSSILTLFFIFINVYSGRQINYSFVFLNLFLRSIYIFIAYLILKNISFQNELEIETKSFDTKKVYYKNATKSKRFLNLIIDSIVVLSVLYSIIESAKRNDNIAHFLEKLELNFGSQISVFIIYFFIKFSYYLLFEITFNTTPAKILTNTTLVDDNDEKISSSNIVKRTLLRFIPFESITFLTGSNFHDDYSYTQIANNKKTNYSDGFYLLLLSLPFLLFCSIYIYKKIFYYNY